MSSFEWNKIIASVLTAMIVAMVAGILANELVRPKRLDKPVFLVAGVPETAAPAASAAAEPIAPFLEKADVKRGEQIAKVCVACHTFNKGGANRIGPNLWAIMEEGIAEVPNYQFSPAMTALKGQKWDPDKLSQWLLSPQSLIKGTKMTFAGIPDPQRRADVIAYLETLK